MNIQAIFLDIGRVLVGLNYRPAMDEISRRSGLSTVEIRQRLSGDTDITEYESGRLSTAEFYRRLSNRLEIDVSLEEFKQIWHSVLLIEGDGLCSPGLFQALRENHRVIALSNTNEMQFEHLRRVHPLIPQFHDYVLSYQVGCMKPNEAIYLAALEKAGCGGAEALFVDDLAENVEAAERIGIRGIVYRGEEELRQHLARMGLL